MGKIYCCQCAKPNNYTISKPDFCSYCNANLNDLGVSNAEIKPKIKEKNVIYNQKMAGSLASEKVITKNAEFKKKNTQHRRNLPKEVDLIDEENEDLYSEAEEIIPEINSLELEDDKIRPNKGIKLGELAFAAKTGFVRPQVKNNDLESNFNSKWNQLAGNNGVAIEINDNGAE